MPPCTFPIHSKNINSKNINSKNIYDFKINTNFISKVHILIKNIVDEYFNKN